MAMGTRAHGDDRSRARVRRVLVTMVVLVISAAIGSWASSAVKATALERYHHFLQLRSAAICFDIEQHIRADFEVVRSIASFFKSSQLVEANEFGDFTEAALAAHPELQALQWVPRIVHGDKDQAVLAAMYPGLELRELDSSGALVSVSRRDEYYPVCFIQPHAPNERALGFDLGSDPVRRAALELARDTGLPAATDRIRLVQVEGPASGFLLVMPVFDAKADVSTVERRRAHLRGYVAGVFTLQGLLEASLSSREREDLDLHVYNMTRDPPSLLAEYHAGTATPTLSAAAVPESEDSGVLIHEQTIALAQDSWRVVCTANLAAAAAQPTLVPGVVGVATFSASAFLAAFVASLLRTKRVAERLAEQRTSELSRQKILLDSILDSAAEGIVAADSQGQIVLFNTAGREIVGDSISRQNTLLGMSSLGLFHPDTLTRYSLDDLPLSRAIHGIPTNDVPMFVRNDDIAHGRYLSVSGRPLRAPEGTVTGGVVTFRDVTELLRLQEQLKADAVRDPMTQLYNRRHFDETLPGAINLARRTQAPFCLCQCDLDTFKGVNDTFGHPMGDEVIRRFAHVLRTELRLEDVAYRVGGDEFFIVFPQVSGELAARSMERIRARWERESFTPPGQASFSITCSAGIAAWTPAFETTEAIVAAADRALYEAKQRGRNRVVWV